MRTRDVYLLSVGVALIYLTHIKIGLTRLVKSTSAICDCGLVPVKKLKYFATKTIFLHGYITPIYLMFN